MEITDLEMIARVALAAVLGAALGIEREVQHKTAGLRTHTLVASGAALFSVAGASVAVEGTDLTRVAAQVVTGIGFIGAGGMIKSGFTMTGITTAATLWFAAALGVATGFGLYVVATAALAVALVSIVAFAPIRTYIRRGVVQPLEIEYYVGHGTLTPLFETLNAIGAQVHRISMVEDEGKHRMSCELVGVGKEAMDGVVASLRSRAEVINVKGPNGQQPSTVTSSLPAIGIHRQWRPGDEAPSVSGSSRTGGAEFPSTVTPGSEFPYAAALS